MEKWSPKSGGEHGHARSPEQHWSQKVVVNMDTLISGTWAWAPASIHEIKSVRNFTWDPRQTSPNFSEGGWGRGEGICGNQTKSADGFPILFCILPNYPNFFGALRAPIFVLYFA